MAAVHDAVEHNEPVEPQRVEAPVQGVTVLDAVAAVRRARNYLPDHHPEAAALLRPADRRQIEVFRKESF